MQVLLVIVKSKSIKSFSYFINFLIFCFKKITKKFIKKINLQKLNKIKITVLKSPHIHKIAQEQLEQRFYNQKILIVLLNLTNLKFFLIIKNLLNFSFYDITFKIKCFLLKLNFNNILKFLNLNNFCLNLNKNYSNNFFINTNSFFYYSKKIKTYNFLKLLNLTGILFLRRNSLVGRTLES